MRFMTPLQLALIENLMKSRVFTTTELVKQFFIFGANTWETGRLEWQPIQLSHGFSLETLFVKSRRQI
jgi:hypothetical protein